MHTKIIEATNGPQNWGKFMLGRFTVYEWLRRSEVLQQQDPSSIPAIEHSLLASVGWTGEHLLVLDLQTGEGAIFRPGGNASADLNGKHKIWVCPLFEPFLNWLYRQDLSDLDKLPALVDLPDAEFQMYGHRRQGKDIPDDDRRNERTNPEAVSAADRE